LGNPYYISPLVDVGRWRIAFDKKVGIFYVAFILPFLLPVYSIADADDPGPLQVYKKAVADGEIQLKMGNFQTSAVQFGEALRLARQLKNRRDEFLCLARLGLLNWNLGHMQECSDFYGRALSLARLLNLKKEEQVCATALEIFDLYSQGKAARSLGKYQQSIQILEKAVALARKVQSREHEVKCLRQMSVNYWELNRFREFFDLNIEAQKNAHQINNRREEGLCFNNIGIYYWKISNYSRALKYLQLSLETAEKENDVESKSQSLNNISLIYIDLGYYEKALEYLIKVLKIDKELKNNNYVSIDLNNIGIIYRNQAISLQRKENFLESINIFKDSLELAKKIDDKKIECTVQNNIGETYFSLGDFNEALRSFSVSLKKANEINDLEMVNQNFNNIGNVKLNLDHHQEASGYFKRSVELSLKTNNAKILWEAYYGMGQCYERNEKYIPALDCYKKSIDIIDRIRSQIFLDTFKAGFVRNKLKVHESLINLLYKLGREDHSNNFEKEIYYFVEKLKARAFLEGLAESKIDIRENLSQELRDEENRISGQITSIIFKISQPGLSEKDKMALGEKLSQEEDSYMRLISKMREENPEAASLVSPELSSLDGVRERLLDGKTALVEYFLGDQRSYLFFITKNALDFYPLPSRQEIEKSVKGYLKILSGHPQKEFLGTLGGIRLFSEFLFPLNDAKYRGIEKLIIIPDGILYYLPFETLIWGQKNQGPDYLINQFQVSYAPSSSVLLFLFEKRSTGKKSSGLLAFGDPAYPDLNSLPAKETTPENILTEFYLNQGFNFLPIPFARGEIREVSKYFPKDRRDIYLGKNATEENVKKPPRNNYQIIHFACHALLDENQPFRSALVLSQDNRREEDGFLQVRELYNLRLNANLVILSACQTGLGKLEKGEGMLGLTRMFFYSGANSVLSTLWPVNDKSTAFFMKKFYRWLAQGRNIAEALRLTKLEMIQSDFSDPYYWAGFILNGDCESRIDFR
jgi:CHAT domain-containing protein/Tfp pilus assembly protein PilF